MLPVCAEFGKPCVQMCTCVCSCSSPFYLVVVVSFLEPVINATEDQNTVDLCVLKVGRHSFDIEVHLEVCDTQSLPAGMTGLRQASRGMYYTVHITLHLALRGKQH